MSLPSSRKAFSVVEILVTVSILGILMALILPAVQSARASMRRISCDNQLRQLMIASHAYQETHAVFPTSMQPCRRLLPFLEQSTLYERLQLNQPVEYAVTVLICPDDSKAKAAEGHTSYLLNEGTGRGRTFGSDSDGILISSFRFCRPADISDGMSHTAYYSERKVVSEYGFIPSEQAAADPNRYLWSLSQVFNLPQEFVMYRDECLNRRDSASVQHADPNNFALVVSRGYNHVLTPNLPGCWNWQIQGGYQLYRWETIVPATSGHSGGVNMAFADSHVRFISDSISQAVWTAIATRSGNEVVGEF